MSPNSRAVKETAKTVFMKNPLNMIIAGLVFLFSFFISIYSASVLAYIGFEFVSELISTVLFITLVIPIFFGLIRYYWRALFSVVDNPISVFYYLTDKKKYFKCLKLIFSVILRALPVVFLLYLPYFTVWLITQESTYSAFNAAMPIWTANLSNVVIILNILADISTKLYFLRFYIAPVLLVADEDMDVSEAIHMSRIISNKSTIEFIYLIFSFIGWILLSVLIIPIVFTLPYFLLSLAVHVRFVIAEYNHHITDMQNNEQQFITVN